MPGKMNRLRYLVLVLSSFARLAGAAETAGPRSPRSYLDEETVTTITTVARPITFAREHPSLTVHARDYISLCAVQINRSGKYSLYLVGFFWSTMDRRHSPKVSPDSVARVTVLVDDHEVTLTAVPTTLKEAGMGHPPCEAPGPLIPAVLYPTDPAILADIAAGQRLVVETTDDPKVNPYKSWGDARDELHEFVEVVNSRPAVRQ